MIYHRTTQLDDDLNRHVLSVHYLHYMMACMLLPRVASTADKPRVGRVSLLLPSPHSSRRPPLPP